MKETELQLKFVKEMCATDGGFGTKLDANLINGIPDVYLSQKTIGRGFLEFKMAKGPGPRKIEETLLQRTFAQDLIKSGTNAGFLVCYDNILKDRTRYYHVITDVDLILQPFGPNMPLTGNALKSRIEQCTIAQKYGQPYPAWKVLETLVSEQQL